MFDLGWGKLILIGIVALVVIGPKELPGALRTLGQWMTKVRRMASEFQNQFHEAMREAELADLKKDVDEMAATAKSYANIDPLGDLQKDIESAVTPPSDFDKPLSSPAGTSTSDTSSPAVTHDTVAAMSPEPAVAGAHTEPAVSPPVASLSSAPLPAAPLPAAPLPAAPLPAASLPAASLPAASPPAADTPSSGSAPPSAGTPSGDAKPDAGRAA